jgi:pimeloyl-ACP methyl ester carboxylesterase
VTVGNRRVAGYRCRVSSARLHFEERGSGPPLLLIHGVMITGEMFEPILAKLASRHRVILPDLRGHGRSRALPPPYTVAQLAADLVELLDQLGLSSTAVLGYSQGGAVAQQLVLDHPERCERLVLACTYAFNTGSVRERIEGHLVPFFIRTLGMQRFAKLILSQGMKQLSAERAAWVIGLIAQQDAALMVQAWRAAMAFDSRRRLSEIRCPTLVIAGAKDAAVPFYHAEQLHAGIAGSELLSVADADHTFIWSHSDEFARVTEAFLSAGMAHGLSVASSETRV